MNKYEELPWDTAPEIVPEVCDNLRVEDTGEIEEKAMQFSERMFHEPGMDYSPRTVAASSVYFASLMVNQKVTQDGVMDASGCNKASLRECYIEIASLYDIEVDRKPDTREDKRNVLHRAIQNLKEEIV